MSQWQIMGMLFRRLIGSGSLVCLLAALMYSKSGMAEVLPTIELSVQTDKVAGPIPDGIYGQFLEHILHSVNGGLWGELIANRSFEEMPSTAGAGDRVGPRTTSPPTDANAAPPNRWQIVGRPRISLDLERPANGRRSAKLVTTNVGDGLGQGGLCVREGDTLRGSLWLRGDAPDGLTARLVDGVSVLAQQTIAAPASEWAEIPLTLTPSHAAADATLQITAGGTAEIWVDQVSLMPDSCAAMGGFRPDLLKAIADLKPASLRWPGGNFASGYRWKNGIGPQVKRTGKGPPDDIDPLALGLDEFMLLCQKVRAEPVVCVPLGRRDDSQLDGFVQDAVDELEYCNGSADTIWGKVRAANGHREPYQVRYWEIDNELYLASMTPQAYLAAVEAFSSALRKKDSQIVVVGCGGGGTTMNTDRDWQLEMLKGNVQPWDVFSIHHYENYSRGPTPPDTTHFATGPEKMEKHFAELRDHIARSANPKLKLYVSEWNYMSIDWRTGLYAAGFLNAMERNGDVISMACPALFLRQTSATSWDNALVNFDNRTWFPAPNYVVMKLYRDHFAPTRLALAGNPGPTSAVATISDDKRTVVLKCVNASDEAVNVRFEITGRATDQAELQLVTADSLTARNTLDEPRAIWPRSVPVTIDGQNTSFNLPRFSVGVLDVHLK